MRIRFNAIRRLISRLVPRVATRRVECAGIACSLSRFPVPGSQFPVLGVSVHRSGSRFRAIVPTPEPGTENRNPEPHYPLERQAHPQLQPAHRVGGADHPERRRRRARRHAVAGLTVVDDVERVGRLGAEGQPGICRGSWKSRESARSTTLKPGPSSRLRGELPSVATPVTTRF